ncbi:MAG: stage II sporulation protein R [Clostridia bacterium]|nr:stage II sporulation protein R [Clostridia bacterium]MBQ9714771.1 stage II sporulation protein R [Clostridia bacterium]
MKKVCIIFLMSIIISLTALGFSGALGEKWQNVGGRYALNANSSDLQGEYLRIHIRADSNENEAQAVKYRVRDEVVAYLTPLVAEYATKEEAMQGIALHLTEIARVATALLRKYGFSYGASAALEETEFPTRVYEGYTLPAGEYSALMIRLGRGEGDNWWCVAYPPLCFTGGKTDVRYKSKIMEIIKNFQK